ncbi:MAG: TlyA family RNA methyltransferase [Oligoflexales bacterium]
MIRVDDILVQRGLAKDIKHAQSLVIAGKIIAEDQRVDKPGHKISSKSTLRIKQQKRWVSRSGQKLFDALEAFALQNQIENTVALDIGSSTGGFTQCLLEAKASKVYAVDVGTNQMAWSLRQDARVEVFEQTDIRDFACPTPTPSWVTGDVSFISLTTILPALTRIAPSAQWLLLVKPQFEVPKKDIPTGGIITDQQMQEAAIQKVIQACLKEGRKVISRQTCKVSGRYGNQETFILLAPERS